MAKLSRLSRSIDGRVACVSGAASGIGRATARLFADEGARVALVDRAAEAVAAAVAEITDAGGDATGFAADLADTAQSDGVIGLTRSLAVELGHQGVNVNCICPGPINTGMTAEIPDAAKARFARRKVPLQRYAEPEEVAHGILSLVLPASSYINGAVLVVDGGMTAKSDLGSPKAT